MSAIEETFGVDASAPAGGMMAAAAGPAAEEAVEKTEFDLVITDVDSSKRIAIIKVGRYTRRIQPTCSVACTKAHGFSPRN